MSAPAPDTPMPLDLSIDELLNAAASASAQQIAALIRRIAELEAINAALRRKIAATNGEAGHG